MKKLLPLLLGILLLAGCAETYNGPTVEKTVLGSVETYYTCDGEITQESRTEYAYDVCGNQSVVMEYSGGEAILKTVLRHDEAGNCIRQTQYDLSGWLPRKLADNRYTYDDQGRMTGSTHSEEPAVTIHYDDEANTRTTVSGDSTIVEYLDEKGWVMRIEYPGTDRREEYDHRADGQWSAIRSYAGGELDSTRLREFDDQGRVTREYTLQNGVVSTEFRWEYADSTVTFYQENTRSITEYNPDGTVNSRLDLDENGEIFCHAIYRYTTILVPTEEVTP